MKTKMEQRMQKQSSTVCESLGNKTVCGNKT